MAGMSEPMCPADVHTVALCGWREARGEGFAGMRAVMCVIRNRALKHNMTPAQVVMVKWAFSSMTAPHDPQLGVYPGVGDAQFAQCESLARSMADEPFDDVTQGATLYYDTSIAFPSGWNRAKVQETVQIGRLKFWREL